MPRGSRRSAPRASRLTIDALRAIHACSDLIDYWDVGHRSGAVVVRVRSRARVASEHVASDLEQAVTERIRSLGHDVREVASATRLDPGHDHLSRVFVELVIC